MQSNLSNSKSVLARLLAGENLNVVHSKIPTAYFDLDNRTIHCPIWEDMDGALYDLLMGHEVSHGLHTPKEGWHHNVSTKGKGYKSVLNVIEDARIEKKIKRMYPGLSKSFAAAYHSLYQRDFFGIKRLGSLDKLNLADRINCYFKLGHLMFVPFTDEERVIVRDIENADTWEQVVDIADRVYDYMKDREQDKVQTVKDLNDQQVEDFVDDEDAESEEYEAADGEDEESEAFNQNDVGSESDENDNGQDSSSQNSADSQLLDDPKDDDVKSVTDQIFREREKELVIDEGDNVSNMELPEPVLENIVMPFDIMIDGWHKMMQTLDALDPSYKARGWTSSVLIERSHRLFRETNQNTINLLVKEFEMRKNASQYARAQTSRSGELDMTRLHNYKLTSDVFKRITVTPKGKSHGLILYVDMSGSMRGIFGPTLEQVMILVQFCRRVNIPCDVYGFSDDVAGTNDQQAWLAAHASRQWNTSAGVRMMEAHFHLKPLISTSLNQAQFRAASDVLTVLAYNYNWFNSYRYDNKFGFWAHGIVPSHFGFGLHGTPLTECILASRVQIEKFKSEKRLDVVNVIHLTDGAGGTAWHNGGGYWSLPKVTYITDRRTKRRFTVRRDKQQVAMTQFVRQLTGCKQIGYYVVEGRTSRNQLHSIVNSTGDMSSDVFEKNYDSFKKDGVFSVPALGYDSYFFLRQNSSNLDDAEFKVEDNATKGKLKSAFVKHLRGKKSNRALCTQFAEQIAV